MDWQEALDQMDAQDQKVTKVPKVPKENQDLLDDLWVIILVIYTVCDLVSYLALQGQSWYLYYTILYEDFDSLLMPQCKG